MTYPPLVGLIGHARAGKDAFAARLCLSHDFARLAFADRLKCVLLDLNPDVVCTGVRGWEYTDAVYTVAELVGGLGWEEAKREPHLRQLLQNLGMAMRHHVDDEVWIAPVRLDAHHERHEQDRPVVVTDVRFRNEAEWIEAEGGVLVRVVSEREDQDGHVSETELDHWPCEWYVRNDGDLADLSMQADNMVAALDFTASCTNVLTWAEQIRDAVGEERDA